MPESLVEGCGLHILACWLALVLYGFVLIVNTSDLSVLLMITLAELGNFLSSLSLAWTSQSASVSVQLSITMSSMSVTLKHRAFASTYVHSDKVHRNQLYSFEQGYMP